MAYLHDGTQDSKRSWWRRPVVIGNVLFVVAVAGAVQHFGSIEQFGDLFERMDVRWMAFALLLQIGTYACMAGLLVMVLRRFTPRVRVRDMAGLTLAKLFVDQVIPTAGVGGSILVAQTFIKQGAARGEAMATLLTEVISRWLAYVPLFTGAVIILWLQEDVTPAVRYIAIAFTVVFILVLAIVSMLLWSAKTRRLPAGLRRIRALHVCIASLEEVPTSILRSKTVWVFSFLLQGGIFLLDALTLYACLRGLGAVVSVEGAFVSFMLASAIATISLLPGGIGVFEGVAIGVLASLGVSFEAALASTILLRGFTTWLPMVPGFLLFRKQFI